jgi:hypothetical protein
MKKRPLSSSDDPFERWEARLSACLQDPRLKRLSAWTTLPRLRQLQFACLALLGVIVLMLIGRIGAAALPLLAVLIGIGVGIGRGVRPVLYLNLIVTALAAVTLPFLLTLGGMYTDREQVGSFDAGIGGFTLLLLMAVLTVNGLTSAALLWLTRYHHE